MRFKAKLDHIEPLERILQSCGQIGQQVVINMGPEKWHFHVAADIATDRECCVFGNIDIV